MKKDFSTIIQIGIIVPDAQSVSSNLKRFLGWETQKTWETSRVSGRIYRGEAADFACRMDFFQLPGMELEIIQPLTGPSCWQDYLDENGCGIHHLLFDVNHSADSFAALHGDAAIGLRNALICVTFTLAWGALHLFLAARHLQRETRENAAGQS